MIIFSLFAVALLMTTFFLLHKKVFRFTYLLWAMRGMLVFFLFVFLRSFFDIKHFLNYEFLNTAIIRSFHDTFFPLLLILCFTAFILYKQGRRIYFLELFFFFGSFFLLAGFADRIFFLRQYSVYILFYLPILRFVLIYSLSALIVCAIHSNRVFIVIHGFLVLITLLTSFYAPALSLYHRHGTLFLLFFLTLGAFLVSLYFSIKESVLD